MENLEEFLVEFRRKNENLLKISPYILLVGVLVFSYFNLSKWNLMVPSYLMLFLGLIFILTIINQGIAVGAAAVLMSFYYLSVNVELACLIFIVGVLMLFGAEYGKNGVAYIAVFLAILNMNHPFMMGVVLTFYGLYFVNRGFGAPFIGALITTVAVNIYGLITGVSLFPYTVLEEPQSKIIEYVGMKLSDPTAFSWLSTSVETSEVVSPFMETLKANIIPIIITFVVLYGVFVVLKSMKQKEKECILSKVRLAYLVIVVSLIAGMVLVNVTSKLPIPFMTIILFLVGSVFGLVLAVVLPRYQVYEILSFEEKQALEEKEKLDQVVKTLESKDVQGGWDSIAGYQDVKEELKQVLEPYLDPQTMKRMRESHIEPIKGLLLFGPPGSGKTLFARAIAAESKMNIITVAGSEFTSKWVGESDRNLRNIFEKARYSSPCIIFFDELESFLPERDSTNYSWEKTLVTTFLNEMDGFNKLKDVLVVGATNYPDKIDPAAIRPGRFDKCIYIGTPDIEAKQAILRRYLGEKSPLSDDELRDVAVKLERFTAADIEGFIKELYRQNKYESLSVEDIVNASSTYKPTVTLDMLDRYEALEKKYNRRLVNEEESKPVKEKKNTWDDIAGMDDVKADMRKYVEKPLIFAEKYKELDLPCPKGVLMFGPPGCGKTLFAKVVSNECNASFFTINGPELLSGKIGESEMKLRRVFRDAREQKPSIIFFDEFDAIAENRALNNSGVKLINQLLTEMDGMEGLEGVMVLAATNRIDIIDPALRRPGRFDNIVYIGLPDFDSREKQFALHLKNQIDDKDFHRFAELSEGFSCADIAGVCRKMKEKLLDLMIEGSEMKLSQEECEEIIQKTNKTLTPEEIQAYEEMKQYERN